MMILTKAETLLWGFYIFFYCLALWGAYEFAYQCPGVHPFWSGTFGYPVLHHYLVGFIGMVPCVYYLTFVYREREE